MQGSLPTVEDYFLGMGVIRESNDHLRLVEVEFILTAAIEIEFFQHVQPVFVAEVYNWLHCLFMSTFSSWEDWAAVIKEKEDRAKSFFRQNADFRCYYKSGAPVIDG